MSKTVEIDSKYTWVKEDKEGAAEVRIERITEITIATFGIVILFNTG